VNKTLHLFLEYNILQHVVLSLLYSYVITFGWISRLVVLCFYFINCSDDSSWFWTAET